MKPSSRTRQILPLIPLLPLLVFLFTGCPSSTDPDDPDVTAGKEVTMTQITDLPMVGGDVADVAFLPDNSLIAVIDQKLYTISASGGAPQLAYSDANYTRVVTAPDGTIYAQTTSDLRVISSIGAAPTVTTVATTGQFVEATRLTMTPTGEPFMQVFSYPATMTVWHSTDRGATWKKLGLPNNYAYGGGINIDPSGNILLTGPQGFYKSSDRGTTWTSYPAPLANYGGEVFTTSNGDIYYYVPLGGGLRVSRNGGSSFTELQQFNRYPLFNEVMAGGDGNLYGVLSGGIGTGDSLLGLLRSTDGGANWKPIYVSGSKSMAIRGNSIAVAIDGSGTQGTVGGLALSRDMGKTWTITGTAQAEKVADLAFDGSGNLLLLADHHLLRRSTTGWNSLGARTSFNRLAATHNEVLIGEGTSVLYSADGGGTWKKYAPTEPLYPGMNDGIGNPVMLGLQNGGFLFSMATVSTNGSEVHQGFLYKTDPFGKPVVIPNVSGDFTSIVEGASQTLYGNRTYLDGISYTYRSEQFSSNDGGTTWTQLQTTGWPFPRAINSAGASVGSGGNTGLTFAPVSASAPIELTLKDFPTQANYITRVAFGPDDRLYVVTMEDGVWVSTAPLK